MKKVPVVKITTPHAAAELAGLPLEATVAMADVAAAMRDGLLAFSAAAGLVVMRQMLDAELASIVGVKHAKLPGERVGNWHGTTTGQVVLGARKISVERPHGRYVDGGEVELDTWATFASEDLLRQVVVERMLAGVATRRHVEVAEPVGHTGTAVSKSAVSRRFVAATQAAVGELLEADLSALETAVLMVDGLNVAGEMIVVALVICADGRKVPVGLRLGDTENTVVVKDLLPESRCSRPAVRARDPCGARRLEGVAVCGREGVRHQGPGAALHPAQEAKRHRLSARRPARHHRRATPVVDEHELHRIDDLDRASRDRSGQNLERR